MWSISFKTKMFAITFINDCQWLYFETIQFNIKLHYLVLKDGLSSYVCLSHLTGLFLWCPAPKTMYPSSLFQHTQHKSFPALPSFTINLTVLNLHLFFQFCYFLSPVPEYFLHLPKSMFFALSETKFQSDTKQLVRLGMIMDIF